LTNKKSIPPIFHSIEPSADATRFSLRQTQVWEGNVDGEPLHFPAPSAQLFGML